MDDVSSDEGRDDNVWASKHRQWAVLYMEKRLRARKKLGPTSLLRFPS